MAAITLKTVERSWKPFFGNYVQVLLGVTYLKNYAHGKPLTTVSIDGQKRVCGRNFF